MVVERFSQNMINSGIFKLYIATGFFATLIFFVLNAELFTPMEIIFGVVAITTILRGISNLMLSFIISLFSFDKKRQELDFKYNEEKINSALNELSVKDVIENEKKEE